MAWFRRKRAQHRYVSGHGTIVVDGTKKHRCQPPGAREWPAGSWKVDQTKKYPEGTVWRCDCGRAWVSGRYEPGRLGQSDSLGMWLNWYRIRKHDAEPPDSGQIGANDNA